MAKQNKIVLGISFGHGDSSACLLINGQIIAAAEEERFSRIKHDAGFPFQSIEYCLKEAGLNASDIPAIAIAKDKLAHLNKKIKLAFRYPGFFLLKKNKISDSPIDLNKCLKSASLNSASIYTVEHHYAHLMSSRFLTKEDNTALLSFDGLGDFVSTTMGKSSPNGVDVLKRVFFPHSLGFFYTAMTQYLGFPYFGDEFKLMGLSSYGAPKYLPALRKLIKETDGFGFKLNLEAFPVIKNPPIIHIEKSQPSTPVFYNKNFLTHVIGLRPRKPNEPITQNHKDLANSIQIRFEEVANHLLNKLFEKVPSTTLLLSGGCAHNSVWVGKIPEMTPFKKVIVAPASHDAGIAIGAAITVYNGEMIWEKHQHSALLGPRPNYKSSLEEKHVADLSEHEFKNDKKLWQWLGDELANGKIIGVCQGRLEFGPRALGNRSILADPRHPEMRDKLNSRVKHRENFRPFAVSVLWENQDEWFKNAFECPTMEAVFEVREGMRKKIPAAVHIDNTCRIQTIRKEVQPFYWNLIETFRKKTGIPMLINTSFNDSEPIVCGFEDAIRCFHNCDMDHLVIDNRVFSKKSQAKAKAA